MLLKGPKVEMLTIANQLMFRVSRRCGHDVVEGLLLLFVAPIQYVL